MKPVDYEKKYKDALERARELHRNEEDKRSTMEFLFPELKESEGEKIRKRILLSLEKDLMATKNSGCNTKDLEECIAWLEKQGEQKVSIVDFKAEDWYVSKVDGKIHNMYYVDKFEQCIQYGDKIVTNEDGTHFNVSQLERVVKKESNSTWSKEDEEMLSRIRVIVRNYNSSRVEDILWLKSLKERIKGK